MIAHARPMSIFRSLVGCGSRLYDAGRDSPLDKTLLGSAFLERDFPRLLKWMFAWDTGTRRCQNWRGK
jgi:hypothetical protein